MSLKTFVILFLIIALTLTPITAEEEFLNIDIELPDFYEINVYGVSGKPIGISGVVYPGYVTVKSPNEEIDLTNRSLEIRFYYSEIQKMTNFDEAAYKGAKPTYPIFGYNNNPTDSEAPPCKYKRSFEFNDSFNLSDIFGKKLRKGENITKPLFQIEFFETGSYIIEWMWMTEKGEASYRVQRISIIDPTEYEALLKQAQLIEAEKQSAEASLESANASKDTASSTKRLAIATFILVLATFAVAFVNAYMTNRSISENRKFRESEIHTAELKKLAKLWMAQLPEIPALDDLKPAPERYQIEDAPLFLDIANHIPSELNLLQTWNDFKTMLADYAQKKEDLFDAILSESVKRSGLEYDSHLEKDNTLSEDFIRTIYRQLVFRAKNHENTYTLEPVFLEKWEGYVTRLESISGSYLYRLASEERQKEIWGIYKEMMEDSEIFLERIHEIIDTEADLNKCHVQLTEMLDEFISIPIVPGTCKSIKRAL